MKVLLVLALVIGIVYCEPCNQTDTTSCAHENCIATFVPTCISDICTCNPKPTPSAMCHSTYDCQKMNYWINHHCAHHFRACMNGDCVCTKPHGHG